MKPSKKLDLVLENISEAKEFIASKKLFENLKNVIDKKELTIIVNKLFIDGYIEKKILGGEKESKLTPPYFCRITFSGLIFLERGGYYSENKKLQLENIWTKAKIVANIFNAILILIIAAAGVYVTIDSKKKDETIEKRNLKIDSLKIKL